MILTDLMSVFGMRDAPERMPPSAVELFLFDDLVMIRCLPGTTTPHHDLVLLSQEQSTWAAAESQHQPVFYAELKHFNARDKWTAVSFENGVMGVPSVTAAVAPREPEPQAFLDTLSPVIGSASIASVFEPFLPRQGDFSLPIVHAAPAPPGHIRVLRPFSRHGEMDSIAVGQRGSWNLNLSGSNALEMAGLQGTFEPRFNPETIQEKAATVVSITHPSLGPMESIHTTLEAWNTYTPTNGPLFQVWEDPYEGLGLSVFGPDGESAPQGVNVPNVWNCWVELQLDSKP